MNQPFNNLDKSQKTYANTVLLIEQFMEGALDDKIKEEIRKKGLLAGVFMAIPLWGIETIAYAFVLWSTYSKISSISGVPFRENFVKNVVVGFVTNIVITFALGCALDFIPVAGWIGSFIIGYLSIQLSGMSYVKALKLAHGEKVKMDVNFKNGVEAFKNNVAITDTQNRLNHALNQTAAVNNFIESTKAKDIEGISAAYHDFAENGEIIGDEEVVLEDIPEELPIAQEQINSHPVTPPQLTEDVQPQKSSSKVEQLRELKKLLDDGILTQEEFDAEKAKILNN